MLILPDSCKRDAVDPFNPFPLSFITDSIPLIADCVLDELADGATLRFTHSAAGLHYAYMVQDKDDVEVWTLIPGESVQLLLDEKKAKVKKTGTHRHELVLA